jgi:hypothetical protein
MSQDLNFRKFINQRKNLVLALVQTELARAESIVPRWFQNVTGSKL